MICEKDNILLNFKKYFFELISNSKYMFLVLVFNFLGYGFLLYNRVIHVDDLDSARFYTEYGMIKMGRFTTWFIDYFLNIFHYNIFFLGALSLIVMIIASIMFSALLKCIIKRISFVQLAFVSIILSVFAMSFYMNIFVLATLSVSLCYVILIVLTLTTLSYALTNKLRYLIYSVLLSILLMSVYESFMFIYLQVFAFIILLNYTNLSKIKIKKITRFILIVIAIFLLGVILEFVISNLLILIMNLEKFSYTESQIAWFEPGTLFSKIKVLFGGILINYYFAAATLKSSLSFVVMSLVYFVTAILLSIKNKNSLITLFAVIGYLLIFSVSIVTSMIQIERMSQGIMIFMACSFSLLFSYLNEYVDNKKIKTCAVIVISVFCLWNAQELSEAHEWAYRRSKAQENAINQIIVDKGRTKMPNKVYIYGQYAPSKKMELGMVSVSKNRKIGKIIDNMEKKLGIKKAENNNKIIKTYYSTRYYLNMPWNSYRVKLFNHFGADYKECSTFNDKNIKSITDKMPIYPEDGYIKKYNGCTIIRIGK